MLNDPLKYYYSKTGYDPESVANIISGEKYLAVILKNGKLGVCATLNHNIKIGNFNKNPDLERLNHRVIYNAYLNAHLNYKNDYSEEKDIFDKISFDQYQSITMIGYFQSLIDKFVKKNIKLTVFDKIVSNNMITSLDKQIEYVAKSDALILTSTSIFNSTFFNLVNNTPEDCDIYMLGPSSILDTYMLSYRNIKMIFGALFRDNDQRVMDVIKKGGGTKKFLPFMKKVYINRL